MPRRLPVPAGFWDWAQTKREQSLLSSKVASDDYQALPDGIVEGEQQQQQQDAAARGAANGGADGAAPSVSTSEGKGADDEEQEALGSRAAQVDHSFWHRELVSAGVAAGIAGAFGSPVGGVLFSLEEACTHWSRNVAWRCFLCAAMASFVHWQLNPS